MYRTLHSYKHTRTQTQFKQKTKDKHGHALIYLEILFFILPAQRADGRQKRKNQMNCHCSVANLGKFTNTIKYWKKNIHTHMHTKLLITTLRSGLCPSFSKKERKERGKVKQTSIRGCS